MRLLAGGFFGLALALAPCHGAVAQEWPARPVTMIVPFPASGPADIAARATSN
jgi:tripartite-type tricarboxylate transporter receptor subunit TctC